MNWSNQLENRVLVLGTALVMAVGFWFYQAKFVRPVYESQNRMMQQLVEQQNQLIEALAKDPKYAIQNDFGKMKPKDGSTIALDIDNRLDVSTPPDSVKVAEKKKGFFRRLFGGK